MTVSPGLQGVASLTRYVGVVVWCCCIKLLVGILRLCGLYMMIDLSPGMCVLAEGYIAVLIVIVSVCLDVA